MLRWLPPDLSGPFTISNSTPIAFLQAFVPFACDCTVVNKDICATVSPDETVSLRVIEPFDGTLQTLHGAAPF